MNNLLRRFISHLLQVLHHLFTHGDKSVYRLDEVRSKGFITRSFFMWVNIISNAYNPRMLIFLHPPKDGPKAWAHKR